ncbi:MAG: glycyl-radical enzyme activating protein [Clostridium sp.]
MDVPYVINIQKYSVHDGAGIRTTVFFKGCPLSCSWCHNPESQHYTKELMLYHERCTNCGACVAHCPNKANLIKDGHLVFDRSLCTACGICTDYCLSNAREVVGKTYTVKDLVKELEKDRMFYEDSGGGITLSGGEVMIQNMDFIEELCKTLYKKGYSINIDTCGYAPYENFERVLPYIDTFLYDIKHMDPETHKKYMGVDNKLILDNLSRLNAAGATIALRLPIIDGVNDSKDFIEQVIAFLKEHRIHPKQIHLLPYHNTGKSKYENLDRTYADDEMKVPKTECMELFKDNFINHGYANTKIGG